MAELRFDSLPHVAVHDIDHLYWGRFPYRILLRLDRRGREAVRHLNSLRKFNTRDWKMFGEAARAVTRSRNRLRTRLISYCPSNPSTWRSASAGNGLAFYFENAADAQNLLDSAGDLVRVVNRPRTPVEIEALRANRRMRIRDRLFWNAYRWRIVFRIDGVAIRNEVDRWVTDMLAVEEPHRTHDGPQHQTDRSAYIHAYERRLYLANESDVIMVKLALAPFIARIEEALLKSEIDDASGPFADLD